MTLRAVKLLLVQLGALASALPAAHAQEFRPNTAVSAVSVAPRLLIEVGQGPSFTPGEPGTRYAFTGSLLPGMAYGILELSAVGSAIYRNPEWDVGAGARLSAAVLSALEGAFSVRVGAEASYLFRASGARLAAGLIPDISSLLRLGLWVGRDFEADSTYAVLTIGSDITTWRDPIGAVIQASPMEDFDAGP